MGLGDRLKRARIALGLSCSELARRAGMDPKTPTLIEAGSAPRIDHVARLAAALGTDPGSLAYGLGPAGADPAGIAMRVRSSRTELGISIKELERAAGLAVGTARNIEIGMRTPTVRTVERLAIALGTDPGWLGFGPA